MDQAIYPWQPVVKRSLSAPLANTLAGASRLTIEKGREIITGILHGAANFWNWVYRESVENSLDPLMIDLSVNAREVAEADRYDAANAR